MVTKKGKLSILVKSTEIKITSNSLLLVWKTKMVCLLFKKDCLRNQKRIFFDIFGIRFEYGTTQLQISFGISKAVIFLTAILLYSNNIF